MTVTSCGGDETVNMTVVVSVDVTGAGQGLSCQSKLIADLFKQPTLVEP